MGMGMTLVVLMEGVAGQDEKYAETMGRRADWGEARKELGQQSRGSA